jgi:hypothetical protein
MTNDTPENVPQDNRLESIRLQINVSLAEYDKVREVVMGHREIQSQLDNFTLAGLGLSIPLILFVIEQKVTDTSALLLIPLLFFAIAFTQVRHERILSMGAMYIDSILQPKLSEMLSQLAAHKVSVLEYERFLRQSSKANGVLLHWVNITLNAGISLLVGLGMTVLYFCLRPPSWTLLEVLLLIANVLAFITTLGMAFFVSRQRSSYSKSQ